LLSTGAAQPLSQNTKALHHIVLRTRHINQTTHFTTSLPQKMSDYEDNDAGDFGGYVAVTLFTL
jgi:hypothetical protein